MTQDEAVTSGDPVTPRLPPPTPGSRIRRGPAPVTLLILLGIIGLLVVGWLASEGSSQGQPVLVAKRPLTAFVVTAPSDIDIETRVAEGALPASMISDLLIPTTSIAEGAVIGAADAVALERSLLPDDPVVLGLPRTRSTIPVDATPGSPMSIIGSEDGTAFSVPGILLDFAAGEDQVVIMLSRMDALEYADHLRVNGAVMVIDPRD